MYMCTLRVLDASDMNRERPSVEKEYDARSSAFNEAAVFGVYIVYGIRVYQEWRDLIAVVIIFSDHFQAILTNRTAGGLKQY